MDTPLQSNEDLYNLVQSLAQHARDLGDEASLQDLEGALLSGMTASEQLGELRSALSRLRARIDMRWPEGSLRSVDDAIEQIDAAFRRANQGG